jgi:hypothetical protein
MNSEKITRKMLSVIRESNEKKSKNTLITEFANGSQNDSMTQVNQNANNKQTENKEKKDSFSITKNTPQFGDIRTSQEEALIKTIGESIELDENALIYYANNKDLVLTGKINSLSLTFQFRFNDPSGDGCYIWANSLQLTDTNNRTLGKIRDAFVNWKNALVQNGDLMSKLHQAATQEK